jgi:hypothetical protein
MAEFGRVCGGHADLIRAVLASISHLNKLPLGCKDDCEGGYVCGCRAER